MKPSLKKAIRVSLALALAFTFQLLTLISAHAETPPKGAVTASDKQWSVSASEDAWNTGKRKNSSYEANEADLLPKKESLGSKTAAKTNELNKKLKTAGKQQVKELKDSLRVEKRRLKDIVRYTPGKTKKAFMREINREVRSFKNYWKRVGKKTKRLTGKFKKKAVAKNTVDEQVANAAVKEEAKAEKEAVAKNAADEQVTNAAVKEEAKAEKEAKEASKPKTTEVN